MNDHTLTELDRTLVWHPYSSMVDPAPVFGVCFGALDTRRDGQAAGY